MPERARRPVGAVTIYDVAAAAGVSHQTVANVMKAPHRVAPATRKKVAHHIAELGFQPNRMAQNLSRQRSNLIGFRVGCHNALTSVGLLDSFLHSMAEAAERMDHHIVLFHSDAGVAEVDKAQALARSKGADAFVVAGTYEGDPRIPAYIEARLPFVTFGRTDLAEAHSWVDVDDVAGGEIATEHLLSLGHRHIGFLGWADPTGAATRRERGWRHTLRRARCRHGASLVARAESAQGAMPAVRQLLDRHPELTALVAASDELALDAEVAAGAACRPLNVTGYGDSRHLAASGRGLTTVRPPVHAIAAEVVRIAVSLGDGGDVPPARLEIAPTLVVRDGAPIARP